MSYQYAGKDFSVRAARHIPFSREEMAAKIAYFREAEAKINGGPAPIYTPPAPLKPFRPRLDVPECGTCSGYARHIRLKEEPCRPCLDARGNYQREYRAKRKAVRQMANASDQLHGCNRDTPGIASEIAQFTSKISSTGSIKAAPECATNTKPGPNH